MDFDWLSFSGMVALKIWFSGLKCSGIIKESNSLKLHHVYKMTLVMIYSTFFKTLIKTFFNAVLYKFNYF